MLSSGLKTFRLRATLNRIVKSNLSSSQIRVKPPLLSRRPHLVIFLRHYHLRSTTSFLPMIVPVRAVFRILVLVPVQAFDDQDPKQSLQGSHHPWALGQQQHHSSSQTSLNYYSSGLKLSIQLYKIVCCRKTCLPIAEGVVRLA